MNDFAEFPQSELVTVLSEKINNQETKYNELYSQTCIFRDRVVLELREINRLFPEYTAHDEDYHVKNLFKIADLLLGKDRYEKMNTMELFLLVISMYAHDWGMAVSEDERYYIATSTMRNDTKFSLLENEIDLFHKFTVQNGGINI